MMRRSLILDTTVRLVFDAALVFSVYLLFAGHNQPGGGFVGGLVAGAAIALRYLAGGLDEVHSLLPVQPWSYLSVGLFLAASTAFTPLLLEQPAFDHHHIEWHLPVLGDVAFTTAAVFDSGVYLIVVGLVLMMFEGLGETTPSEPAQPVQPTEGAS